MSNLEKTLSIIKPDAVERNLTENIKNIFIKNRLSGQDGLLPKMINAAEFQLM